MADITLCSNAKDGCKWMNQCSRFAEPTGENQKWHDYYFHGVHCLAFILRVGRK